MDLATVGKLLTTTRTVRKRLNPVPQVHRVAWRPDLGDEPAGARLDIHVHAAAHSVRK